MATIYSFGPFQLDDESEILFQRAHDAGQRIVAPGPQAVSVIGGNSLPSFASKKEQQSLFAGPARAVCVLTGPHGRAQVATLVVELSRMFAGR
jgi:hypothetical protein